MPKDTTNVTLPMSLIDQVDTIVKKGLYTSRADFVKAAIRDLVLYHDYLEEKRIERLKRLEKTVELGTKR